MNARTMLAAAMTLLAPVAAQAEGQPTPEEIAKVMGYFQGGKGQGPVLTDFKACLTIDNRKDSPTRFECLEPVSGAVKKGTVVHAWTSWFVPQDDKYDDITVQFVHEGSVRATQDILVTTAYRTRSYKTLTLSKPGRWEIKLMRAGSLLATSEILVDDTLAAATAAR